MTLRQAAQRALKEMDDHMYRADTHEFYEAKEALRAALAEPEQEPVAWLYRDSWGTMKLSQIMPPPVGAFPVYTAPTPRKPLTDEALHQVIRAGNYDSMEQFARAIERHHGIGEQHE